MRTLKKVLALTVVLATMFSLTAFAGFTDADQINESCQDDINLMNALNVMVGDTEGTFRPNGTISRAEAAKMVYVVRNGGVDDKASGWTGMKVFSDVPSGAWYEGYVNYCASLGIIAGVGNNKFNPDGAVTGVELAKMMLVVAGYKPDVQGYTGANWSLNVINDAQQANMFEGYAIAFSASAPRQWAAKLFSNAILKTQMALYLGGELVNGAAFMADAETVGEKYFSLEIATGVLTQVPHVYIAWNGGTSDLDPNVNTSYISNLESGQTAGEFVFNAPVELLGQEVNVVYKETNATSLGSATSDGLDTKDIVYSMYATGASKAYDTTMDAITLAVNDDNEATIKFAGYNGGRARVFSNASNNGLTVITNLYDSVRVGLAGPTNGKYTVANADALSAKSTAAVRLVDVDNDGILDFAFVTAPIYGTVRSYNADRYDFSTKAQFDGKAITSGRTQESFGDFTFASNIAVDDVIKIDVDVTSGEVLYTVTKVEPIVGALTHIYSTNDNRITVGGSDYGFFGGKFDNQDVAPTLSAATCASLLGKEMTLYTDGSYIFKATEGTANSLGSNFAFVQGVNKKAVSTSGMSSSVIKVQLVLADGKTVVCDYQNVTGTDADKFYATTDIGLNFLDFVGKIVEYKMDGSNVSFRKVASVTPDSTNGIDYDIDLSGSKLEFNSLTGIFTYNTTSYKATENSVLFLPSYDEHGALVLASPATADEKLIKSVSVIKGNELKGTPKMKPGTAAFGTMDLIVASEKGIPSVAYGVLSDGTMTEDGLYAYTTSNSRTVYEDGKPFIRVNAVLSNAEDATPVELTLSSGSAVIGKVYAVVANSNGTYTLSEINTGALAANEKWNSVKGVQGSTISADNDLYTVTKDTKVFVVDMATGAVALGDITAADRDDQDNPYKNIFFAFDAATKNLTTVYVENYGGSVENLFIYSAVNAIDLSDKLSVLESGSLPSLSALDSFTGSANITRQWNAGANPPAWENFTTPVVGGTKYEVTVILNAKEGVMVSSALKLSDVTLPAGYAKESVNVSANGKTVTIVATATATTPKTPIADTDFNVTDLNAAVTVNTTTVDKVLPAIAANSAEFTAGAWSVKMDDSSSAIADPSGETYTGGHKYVAEITLTAASTHKFDATAIDAYKATITGTEFNKLSADVDMTVAADGTTATVTITYQPEKVEIAGKEITVPTAPSSSASLPAKAAFSLANTNIEIAYTKDNGSGTYEPVTGDALTNNAATGSYKVTLTITPDDGYTFGTNAVTFTLSQATFTGVTLTATPTGTAGVCEVVLSFTVA